MTDIDPVPRWVDVFLLPVINLLAALIVCAVVISIFGESPYEALLVMFRGAFLYPGSFGYTLYYTTNFIFTGLAVAAAFQAGLFNIGGDGQAYVSSLGVLLVSAVFSPHLPSFLMIPLCIIGAFTVGALWGFLPGYLLAKRGSHIVITTIMFNFLAASLMVWLLAGPLIQDGQQSPKSELIAESAQLWKVENILEWFGINVASSPLNASFFVAILSLFFFWVLIWKTRFGYEIRAIGNNLNAAVYAGVNVQRSVIVIMMLSGGFAGLMAVNEVMGVQHRIVLSYTAGYGFTGIAVALMGRNHPVGIFGASLLFGALFQGGAELDFEFQSITREIVLFIQALIILFSGALAYMFKPLLSRLFFNVSMEEEVQ